MSYHRTFFLGFYTSKKSEKGGRYSGDKCQIIYYTIYYCHPDTTWKNSFKNHRLLFGSNPI